MTESTATTVETVTNVQVTAIAAPTHTTLEVTDAQEHITVISVSRDLAQRLLRLNECLIETGATTASIYAPHATNWPLASLADAGVASDPENTQQALAETTHATITRDGFVTFECNLTGADCHEELVMVPVALVEIRQELGMIGARCAPYLNRQSET